MYDSFLDETRLIGDVSIQNLDASVDKAADALMRAQRPDGHFVFELEADATIPAEYILLRQYLAEPDDLELERKIGVYLRRIQAAHGGWPLYHDGPFDISATVKAYFALKMIGDSVEAPHMVRAREAILARGGAAAANVFTRIQLALYGEIAWAEIPNMPAELILAPTWFPVHLSKMSYWSRTVIVPLLVLMNLRPQARNPRDVTVRELFKPVAKAPRVSNAADPKLVWTIGFNMLDGALKATESLWPKKLRKKSIDACVAWVVERLNGEDGLGAIYPAMANSVMMFAALGYGEDHPHRAIARKSIENLLVIKDEEAYCQPCASPVWDTALAAHALMEAGGPVAAARVKGTLDWLRDRQVLDVKGDWADRKPDVRPGGWAFQYNNAHYPDLDDTAVVVLAMDRARASLGIEGNDEAIARGEEWIVGLQSKDGGFAAFDADNTHFYLNNIPFADHGALLDPPTVDVAARCVGMLAQLGEPLDSPRMTAAIDYLRKEQEPDGSFWGRWGVNYIYGTWSALVALNKAGLGPTDPLMTRAVDWLVKVQNADGGWGESCDSYKLDYTGYVPAPSTSSQTAWAVLAMMSAGEADHPAVARGIKHLQATQDEDGLWPEEFYTGGGFPRVFYLRYHGYRKFFPLWAMARYRNLMQSNSREVAFGM
ncbi:squalene--hopene cyclase [Caulobacter sp. S45]|uniref:squalene--hopene cyclase n=1 Tax=Caulobacter sp. S45 TaxID=1641861 RepID=UPI00131C4257|nr:squalene--hopene cyclase [Caulobacter sp. S45]